MDTDAKENIADLYAAFEAADHAWDAALVAAWGKDAGEARYRTFGRGQEGTALRAAWEAREASRMAWEAVR